MVVSEDLIGARDDCFEQCTMKKWAQAPHTESARERPTMAQVQEVQNNYGAESAVA